MKRLFAMIFVIAGLAMALPPPAHAQEALDEIEETGPRLGEKEARRILAEELSPGASRQQQVEYYLSRERAAFTLGDAAMRIDTLRRLVALTEAPDKLSPYVGYLWRELWRYGNQTEALELGESLVRHRAATPLQRVTFSVLLGRDYANLGNRNRASELLKQVEAEGIARLGLRLAAEERTGGGTVGFWHEKLAQALLGERRFEEAVAAANEALAVLRASAAGESSARRPA